MPKLTQNNGNMPPQPDGATEALVEQAARRTMGAHEALTLSKADQAAFCAALIDPPEPNERLARAIAEHGRRVGV